MECVMALYSKKYNFIFFHLYKCGGMSLRKTLKQKVKDSNEILEGHCLPRDLKNHLSVKGEKHKQMFDDSFKFTIVRNPFDFLLSTYYYAKTYSNHFWHKDVINMDFKDFPQLYMKYIEIHEDTRPLGANKVTTPYDWVHDEDGNMIMDFVGKLENIDKDFNTILTKIGVEPIDMLRTNVNINNNKKYQQVYDDKTRKFVEKNFAKDLDFFEYKF